MSKLQQVLFIIVIVNSVYSEKLNDPVNIESYGYIKYCFMFGGLVLICFMRHIIKGFEITIPYAIFTITCGVLWGIIAYYEEGMLYVTGNISDWLQSFSFIYLPAIMFRTAFFIDFHTFLKAIAQILIISLPAALLSAVITSGVMQLSLHESGWNWSDAILFGVLTTPTYPMEQMQYFKESSIYEKHIKVLLKGEMLLVASWAFSVKRILQAYIAGYVVQWYQWVMCFLRLFIFGVPFGFIFGVIGILFMRFTKGDPTSLIIVTFVMAYAVYTVVTFISYTGIVATTITGAVMAIEREALNQKVDKILYNFWATLIIILNMILYIDIGAVTVGWLAHEFKFRDYMMILVTYLVDNLGRLVSFLIFSPILSRVGYGMSFQTMVVCVWGGLKNPLCLIVARDLYDDIYWDAKDRPFFFMHVFGLYMLMLLINGSSLKLLLWALGLGELSSARYSNMNNSLKVLRRARERAITIMKMDRFMANANWPVVLQMTMFRHPYIKKKSTNIELDEDNDEIFLDRKYTYCADCHTNIPNEPTPKEYKEMVREAKLRILKLKKTAYWRIYENGMISKGGIRTLNQAVEIATDNQNLTIEIAGLFKLFTKEGIFYKCLRNRISYFIREAFNEHRPPRKHWRLMIYRFIKHHATFIIMDLIALAHLILVICHVVSIHVPTLEEEYYEISTATLYTSTLFSIFYLIEIVMKIVAYSWIYICKHGFKFYFRSLWNIFEFITFFVVFICITIHFLELYAESPNDDFLLTMDCLVMTLLIIRQFHMLKYLRYFYCCHDFTPSIIKYLDSRIDRHKALAFELSKNYIDGEQEILENLNQIIDDEGIREQIRSRMDTDKLIVTRRLGVAQKDAPNVAAIVKSKLAMRTVLSSMRDDLDHLKASGWVDDVEYHQIMYSLEESGRYVKSIKSIPIVTSKSLFKEIQYMGDQQLVDFLYGKVTARKYNEGEIIFNVGNVADCICIVISGLLMVSYNPDPIVLEQFHDVGAVPMIDQIYSLTYEKPLCDYVVPGNTLGEFSILTNRPYNGIVSAETASVLYLLNKTVIEEALKLDPDPVYGLACRIWKYLSFRRAVTILTKTPSYRSFRQDQIKYTLERAFVPDLSNFKEFIVNDMITDVILIEGLVVDFHSREIYSGTCYIPRSVQRIILPRSDYIEIENAIETRLLIIPAKLYNGYQIMLAEEQQCEVVDVDVAMLLQNRAKDKDKVHMASSKSMKYLKSFASSFRAKQSVHRGPSRGGVQSFRNTRMSRVLDNINSVKRAALL